MKRFLVALAILALIVFGCYRLAVVGYRLIWPNYGWNQKLTVTIETPGGEVSGSGIVDVMWSDSPDILGDAPHWHSEVHGEATVVDLGDGKYLFALIGGAERLGLRVLDGGRLPQDTDGLASYIKFPAERTHGIAHPVPQEFLPLLVTFTDIADPTTVRRVDPDDLAASFGPGYALTSVTLEITDEPVTKGEVEKVLEWLLEAGQNRSAVVPRRPGTPARTLNQLTLEERILLEDFLSLDHWRK